MYLFIILTAYIAVLVFGYILDSLNLSHLKRYGQIIPPEFEGYIDQTLLDRTCRYNLEHGRFAFVISLFNNVVLAVFIFKLLNIYNSWVISLGYSFVPAGLIFFLLLACGEAVLSVPFSLYSTFRIENRYGFNRMTLRLWIADFLKSLVVSTVLMSLLIAAGLYIIQVSPQFWWLWVWCLFLLFGIFVMYISPYVIEPLFHKFSPLDDKELEGRVKDLMERAGLRISRVFKVDASRRTGHTNAYFTGIGRVKRIVLYDTLLEKMNTEEILSVLAHEAGHWKKRHILKSIVMTESIALAALYISWLVMQSEALVQIFNVAQSSFYVKFVLIGFIGSILSVPFNPLFNSLSRKHEREADSFVIGLTGSGDAMISSLVKLSKDNLSNLHPHPLYALFHYSHPPVLERIRYIRERGASSPGRHAKGHPV